MKAKNYLEFRNISTIITSILLTVFGAILGYLSSIGLNLPVSADVLATIVGGIILAIFSYYNAKNHNTFFNEDEDTIYIPIDQLDKNQIDAINKFIENTINVNLNESNNWEIEIDPALEYEKGEDDFDGN